MTLLDVLIEMKICNSVDDAINVICDDRVEVSNKVIDNHWYRLKNGIYRMRILDIGNYKFQIKKHTLTRWMEIQTKH